MPSTPDSDLPHSPEELYQLAQIILHKQRGRSKADAIRDVTGISKGGNEKYMRWSRMVDLASEPPERFPFREGHPLDKFRVVANDK